MKILRLGHQYILEGFEGKVEQTLIFIEKEPTASGAFKTITAGTTNEEVLRVLIDRLEFMEAKLPCVENQKAIPKLEGALKLLESRTADRKDQGVEGTNKRHVFKDTPKPAKKKKGGK